MKKLSIVLLSFMIFSCSKEPLESNSNYPTLDPTLDCEMAYFKYKEEYKKYSSQEEINKLKTRYRNTYTKCGNVFQ